MGYREGGRSHREKGGMAADAHAYLNRCFHPFLTWKKWVGGRKEGIGRQGRNLDEDLV